MTSSLRRLLIAATASLVMLPSAWAGDVATKDEAVAMVKKGIAYLRAHGKDKLVAEVNAKNPMFVDRDLYLYVTEKRGQVLAHAMNPKLVGRDMGQLKDADGKEFVAEIIKISESGKPGWVEYRWPNPITKQVDDKITYVDAAEGLTFCAGVYK